MSNPSVLGLLVVLTFSLAGCHPYDSDFQCPVPRGVACTPLSKISKMADEGFFQEKEEEEVVRPCCDQPSPLREMVFQEKDGSWTRHEI